MLSEQALVARLETCHNGVETSLQVGSHQLIAASHQRGKRKLSWNFTNVNGPYGGTTEGPAWDGSGLLFTFIPASYIMRYDPDARASTIYKEGTNNANGLMLDPGGILFACEGGGRRMVRYEADGSATVLADGFEGSKLNIPNDLAIDPQGRVWFTDPFYEGAGGAWSADRSNKELDHDSVYRLDPGDDDSWSISRVTFDTTRPNGLLFSLDHGTLYVAQSGRLPGGETRASRLPGQRRRQPRRRRGDPRLRSEPRNRRHVPGRGGQHSRHRRKPCRRPRPYDLRLFPKR